MELLNCTFKQIFEICRFPLTSIDTVGSVICDRLKYLLRNAFWWITQIAIGFKRLTFSLALYICSTRFSCSVSCGRSYFLVAQMGKSLPAVQKTWGSFPGLGRSPGEGNGNPLQYSCLRNPWREEPGGPQSMGSQRVGHDWVTHSFTSSYAWRFSNFFENILTCAYFMQTVHWV